MNNKYLIILIAILVFILVISFVSWVRGEGGWSDLGLNLTTEILGVFLTIFLVDYLLQRIESKKELPRRAVIYYENYILFNRFASLYYKIYGESIEDPAPDSFIEFLNQKCIEKAIRLTDIRKEVLTYPKMTMINYIHSEIIGLEKRCNNILLTYGAFISPKLALILHKLFKESPYFNFLKIISTTYKIRNGSPYPTTLLYYMGDPDEDFKNALIELYQWLLKERKQLIKYNPDLLPPSEPAFISNKNNKRQLRYRIDDIELQQQEERYQEWSDKQKHKNK